MSVDFKEQLKMQLGFLKSSSHAYDQGDTDEGIRIATTLRVIFHSTSSSTSLLNHLGATHIRLLSTGERKIPAGATFWPNITNITLCPMDKIAEFSPNLDAALTKREVRFYDWWFSETVYRIIDNGIIRSVSRQALVLGAANKDGGAHVDSTLGIDYELISRMGAGWAIILNPDNGPSEEFYFKYGHVAALRQMAYEVLNSSQIIELM